MEVYQQMVALGDVRDFIDLTDGALVLMVEEVHLQTCYAQGAVLLAYRFRVLDEKVSADPEDEPYVLLGSVGAELRDVDFRDVLHRGERLVPAFIQNHELETVGGGEVDVVLVGGVVDAGLEIHAVEMESVPPVPC